MPNLALLNNTSSLMKDKIIEMEVELEFSTSTVKFVTINIGERSCLIRYKFETSYQMNQLKLLVNLFDLANLLVRLREENLRAIGLELEIEITERGVTRTIPLPISNRIMLATPQDLIRFELESSNIW